MRVLRRLVLLALEARVRSEFTPRRLCYNYPMESDQLVDSLVLERAANELFGMPIEVDAIVAQRLDCGQNAQATFFLSKKRQLYCYIEGPAHLTLGDIKKMATRMGVRVEMFVPPRGRPMYFDDVARRKFVAIYPGRRDIQPDDLRYYRTLAPYCPALLIINEVKNDMIYCADHDARTGWRPAVKLAYRRILTS